MNAAISCCRLKTHLRDGGGRVFATRKDIRDLQSSIHGDMQTEQRLSTVEAEARSHYKNCDERGERLEQILRAMVDANDTRHAENQKAIGGLYNRFWVAAAAVMTGMATAIGYLLTHGLPYIIGHQ